VTLAAAALFAGSLAASDSPSLTVGGYVEAYYALHLERPSNDVIAHRDFDDRSDTFALSSAVLHADAKMGRAFARLALQYGTAARSYYAAEPNFRPVQEAYAGYTAPIGRGLRVDAGLFLSPLGLEGLAVKDEWNWSRSNVWTGLPTYHVGARAAYPITDHDDLLVAVYNGWNQAIDANREKSFTVSYTHEIGARARTGAMYFAGVERPSGAPEGRAFRQLLDAYVAFGVGDRVDAKVYTDVGIEPNAFGLSGWAAGALYTRVRIMPWLFAAWRGDLFFEKVAEDRAGRAAPIFWPAPWVSSETLTLDARPHENVSVRLEYRHDLAASSIYFAGQVHGGATNARTQDTMTLGATAWF